MWESRFIPVEEGVNSIFDDELLDLLFPPVTRQSLFPHVGPDGMLDLSSDLVGRQCFKHDLRGIISECCSEVVDICFERNEGVSSGAIGIVSIDKDGVPVVIQPVSES